MPTITKDLRDHIRNKAVKSAFEKRLADWNKDDNRLAIECYNFIFPKKIRDIISTVPPEWIRTCSCLRFNADGWSVSLNAGKEMPTPPSSGCGNLGSITGDLAHKVQKHVEAKRTIYSDHAAALTKMMGFLEQFKTFKKLEEAWPEGKKFYEGFNAERTAANLPAVITSEINSMLGIKGEKS